MTALRDWIDALNGRAFCSELPLEARNFLRLKFNPSKKILIHQSSMEVYCGPGIIQKVYRK